MSRSTKAGLVALTALLLAACGQAQQTAEDMTDESAAQAVQSPRPIQARAASPTVQTITIPAGTTFGIEMKNTLNSGENVPGDQFSARVTRDVNMNGETVIPVGSQVRGEVQDVKAAKRGAGKASMTLAFNMLILTDDTAVPLVASLSQESQSKKGRNAAVIGGSAAGGALLGKMMGKDTKSAVVGAVVGGAIGTGVVMAQEGEQVKIPRGTELTIQLDDDLRITR